jgi:hypothetical protein
VPLFTRNRIAKRKRMEMGAAHAIEERDCKDLLDTFRWSWGQTKPSFSAWCFPSKSVWYNAKASGGLFAGQKAETASNRNVTRRGKKHEARRLFAFKPGTR